MVNSPGVDPLINPPGTRFYSGLPVVVILLLFIVSACSISPEPAGQVVTPVPTTTRGLPTPSLSIPSTATLNPSPTSSPTPELQPCDPSKVDYCIEAGTFLLQSPILPPGNTYIDQNYTYGSTMAGTREAHHGVEFSNASGTPVHAALSGVVVYAGDDQVKAFSPWLNFYGNLVILEHDLSGRLLYTLYAHLSQVAVIVGQSVSAGDKIAEVGATGAAIGSHLHFEVRLDPWDYGSTLNPELWLIPAPGNGVLTMRFLDPHGNFAQAQPDVQYHPDPYAPFTLAWQPEVYPPGMPAAYENVLLGNLTAGTYRIAWMWAGTLNERWVEVQPGKLTLVSIEVP